MISRSGKLVTIVPKFHFYIFVRIIRVTLQKQAMAPETAGVAMEVPLLMLCPPFRPQEYIFVPGATTSGFMTQEEVGPLLE